LEGIERGNRKRTYSLDQGPPQMSRNGSAVSEVGEGTKAETGTGAAVAARNQKEKGI